MTCEQTVTIPLGGRLAPVPAMTAWSEWVALRNSPIPASRERAAAIRAELKKIGYVQ